MSIRCRLGYHHPFPTQIVKVTERFGWSGTNAECGRCGKRMWMNWPEPRTDLRRPW